MLDLRSKTRRKLLAYYFTNPAARLHLRDIAEKIGADPSNLSKELARLQREGLFVAEVNGRQKYFELNRGYALLNEVGSIVTKTIGAVPLLSAMLTKVDGIEEAYLYGSFARDRQDAASDIDVLVIGEPGSKNLAVRVQNLEKQLGREINYTVLTRKELDERRARKDAFLTSVWASKRILIGGLREEIQPAKSGLGTNRALPGKRRQEVRVGRKDSRLRR
jgi:predicted nucleotidyltransferase